MGAAAMMSERIDAAGVRPVVGNQYANIGDDCSMQQK